MACLTTRRTPSARPLQDELAWPGITEQSLLGRPMGTELDCGRLFVEIAHFDYAQGERNRTCWMEPS